MARMRAMKLDTALIGKPELRAKLEALLNVPGAGYTQVAELCNAAGILPSHSSTYRWIEKTRDIRPKDQSDLLAAIVRKVVKLNDSELRKLAGHLGIGLVQSK